MDTLLFLLHQTNLAALAFPNIRAWGTLRCCCLFLARLLPRFLTRTHNLTTYLACIHLSHRGPLSIIFVKALPGPLYGPLPFRILRSVPTLSPYRLHLRPPALTPDDTRVTLFFFESLAWVPPFLTSSALLHLRATCIPVTRNMVWSRILLPFETQRLYDSHPEMLARPRPHHLIICNRHQTLFFSAF